MSAQWDRLVHAYGVATDTPAHLQTLDASAFDHFYSAILHQGSIYPATAAVVEYLCSASFPDDKAPEVIAFLAHVFRAASAVGDVPERPPGRLEEALAHYDEDAFWADEALTGDAYVAGVLGVRALAPMAVSLAMRMQEQTDPDVVAPALDLLVHASLATGEQPAAPLYRWAEIGSDHVRQTAIFGLGELGLDASAFLADDSLGVRVAAALVQKDIEVLRAAALTPRELDAAFEPSPQYLERYPRFYVIDALCAAATSWDQLEDAALACLPLASDLTVDHDWGVFLKAQRRLDPENTTYLKALVARKDLWNPVLANAKLVFKDAGLPYNRRACARLTRRRWFGRSVGQASRRDP